MKYGETLQQRSIPLWESYNIDYNDIKHLIKVRTTQGQGQARAIPGSDGEAKAFQAFEDELFRELREQHQRIDLFVQSKAGEIARRLAHLDKQIAQLELRSFSKGHAKLPVRRLEKFSRAEGATLKAGEDIQSLSRFVGAQRTAFQKLLKKYKKWTSSSELGIRFRNEVLERPSSFSKRDFEPLLAQWTEVLAAVRAPFSDGANWQPGPRHSEGARSPSEASAQKKAWNSSAHQANERFAADSIRISELRSTWDEGSNIDIDTALAIIPLGRGATKAIYWVHPDNIVQVHVLLLQFSRLHKSNDLISSPDSPSSSRSSPRISFSNSSRKPTPRTDDEVGVIVCDDLQRFAKRRSSETISGSQDSAGTAAEKAAASIRYAQSGEAVVVVDTSSEQSGQSPNSNERGLPRKVKLKCKAVRQFFDMSNGNQSAKDSTTNSERVSQWLSEHREVQPLVQLQSRRTRFTGLRNNNTGGIWATLDRDVSMRTCSSESLANGNGLSTISEGGKNDSDFFPHAILEVRLEGDADTDLVAALDSSHLTERVCGFSLETHAVATLCKPKGMPHPFWLPALKRDIRKIPSAPKPPKRRPSQGRATPEESSTQHSSVSAPSTRNGHSSSGFSAPRGESSATSAPDALVAPSPDAFKKKRRRSTRKSMLQKRLSQPSQRRQERYWNEFDDGSEGSENEAYTIYVDPNASFNFPGTATVSKFFTSLASGIKASEEKVSSWLKRQPSTIPNERQPLVNGFHSPSVEDSESDDDSPVLHRSPSVQRRYSTFPTLPQSPAVRARETLLFRSCIASFGASFLLLIIATILETTGRRKAEVTVDAGVIIGVASSLVFAIIGVGSTVGRKDNVGWVHRAIVFLVFICVVLGSGGLLAALNHS